MATDHSMERIVAGIYPKSLRHLQQLLMDAEACAKNYGRKSIFGIDKFVPKFEKFQKTLAVCTLSLAEDGFVQNIKDPVQAIDAIDDAMDWLERTYSSWPLAFQFWEVFRSGKQF